MVLEMSKYTIESLLRGTCPTTEMQEEVISICFLPH